MSDIQRLEERENKMKKRIASIVMLVVLIAGIAMAAYGISGRNIYANAANMMGVTQTKICIRMLMISVRSLKKQTMEEVI